MTNRTRSTSSTPRIAAIFVWALVLPLFGAAGCKLLKPDTKKQFGEECTQDADCESTECATYGSVCTKNCTYDKECGGGYVCRARDGKPGDACAKPTGNAVGQTCQTASECQNGYCLKPVGQADSLGFCSGHCETSDDCPANYKICLGISDSGNLKMCLPGDPAAAGTVEPPKFVAPRPVVTVTRTVSTITTTTTTTPTPTTSATGHPLGPVTSSSATSTAPTTTSSATRTTTTTKTPTKTGPKIIIKPPKK